MQELWLYLEMEIKMKIGNIYFTGNKKTNKIALTFDDGPSKETKQVLDILKKERVKATFFVVGKNIKKMKI